MIASKLFYIEWLDSYDNGQSWELIRNLQTPTEMVCASVGWVIKESRKYVIVAPHISDITNKKSLGTVTGCLTIPKAAIVKKELIKTTF
jgi:hypothetical protein